VDPRPDADSEGNGDGDSRMALPGWLAEHAATFAESGAKPAVAKLAATVILLRPAAAGPGPTAGFEVYAVRRAATMAFAAGMYAFPGGGVDPSDSDADCNSNTYPEWTGPGPRDWAERMALPVGPAQAVVCAAVRELFEEAGVLLAGSGADHVLGDLSEPVWETARTDLLARRRSLTGWFGEEGLTLRADLLVPWSRWLTPEFEPRRYDTFFFLALLPEAQLPRDVGGEADHTLWITPADALALPMLPPTRHTLRELAGFADIDAVLAAAAGRDVSAAVEPTFEIRDGTAYLRLP
jgi:8-oxo-dGTP pyrophosphatase MutT (NUDIX family)